MNHAVYLQGRTESPAGDESPRTMETLTTTGNSYQPLSSYPPTTTYYTAPATYFSGELPTHHGLQTVRLPSITASLGGGPSLIKEHPAAVQADQMNSYMEFCFEQDGQGGAVHENVGEEVVVDEDGHHLIQEDDDTLLEDDPIQGNIRYLSAEPSSTRRGTQMGLRKRKQEEQRELEEMLRVANLQPGDRSEAARQRRAEAARSRYQRMTEQERKAYNQKRRLKSLGIDPGTVNTGMVPPQIRDTIRLANAKKAEAARLRYHRMSPEEKREYNQRRTESFRKRREEEELLLSTPAGCISPEALSKAQQIMVRNARKAESARLRYQKMSPAQRKDYNVRRAQSKKFRSKAVDMLREGSELSDEGSLANDSLSDPSSIGLSSSFNSDTPVNIMEGRPESAVPLPPEASLPPVAGSSDPNADPTDEIFQQMEREVMKKTKQAKMILDRQLRSHPKSDQPAPQYTEVHNYQPEVALIPEPSNQIIIDEKSLHDMLITGRDANGMAVELRTVDGHKITEESELRELSQGQTIIIAPCDALDPAKDILFNMHNSDIHHNMEAYPRYRDEFTSHAQLEDPNMASMAQRHTMAKAKRAERARIRYRNMQPELRQAQNAKRADLLRKARARDEELVQMAESREITGLPQELQKAISDARTRRAKRAEQARNKYHRMTSEERRQYNAMRDAQRRQRKRQQEMEKNGIRSSLERQDDMEIKDIHHFSNEPSGSNSISPNHSEQLEERIIYNDYDMYEQVHTWDQ